LGEFSFEIPAREIAGVREQGVDAHGGLLGLHLVDGVFRLATLLLDGKDAKRGDGFKRVVCLGMHHAQVNGDEVSGINERRR